MRRKNVGIGMAVIAVCVAALCMLLWKIYFSTAGYGEKEMPFRIGASLLPEDLHPLRGLATMPVHQVYAYLFSHRYESDHQHLEFKPDIVDKYEITNNGRQCLIKIKHGIRFHNEDELTSEDVIYTWERFLEAKPDLSGINFPEAIAKLIDKYTIVFTSKETVDWENILAIPVLNKKYEMSMEGKLPPFEYVPMGAGPYQFVRYDRDKKIVYLKRFEGYFRGTPKIENVEIHYLPESWMAIAALMQDKIDYYINMGGKDIGLLKTNRNLEIFSFKDNYCYQIMLNTIRPPFNDERIRKALDLIIDRNVIIKDEGGVNNFGMATAHVLHFAKPYTKPEWKPGDPQKAVELLKTAGMVEIDGTLFIDGKHFEINILMAKHNEDYINVARHIMSKLGEFGIRCKITMMDFKELYSKLKSGDYQAMFLEFTDMKNIRNNTQYLTNGLTNYASFSDERIDDILGGASQDTAVSLEEKMKIQKIISEKAPIIPLFYRDNFGVINRRFPLDESILQDPYGLHYLGSE